MVILKVKFQDETRRLTLDNFPNYVELLGTLKQLFPNLNFESISLRYMDDDDELVTISCDLELKEAQRLVEKTNVLRLFLSGISLQFNLMPKYLLLAEKSNAVPNINANSINAQIPQFLNQLVQNLAPQFSDPASSISDLSGLFRNLGIETPLQETKPEDSNQSESEKANDNMNRLMTQVVTSPFIQQFLPHIITLFPQFAPVSYNSINNITILKLSRLY